MSLRYEQHRALLYTRELMRDLLDPKHRPNKVKDLRERVYTALRHFPPLTDKGEPMFSQDGFTED